MPTDEELVAEILAGSQAAMEVLVKRHYKNIFAYIYRHTGDYHTSYDLTQEIFIKMLKSINKYRDKGKFHNWLLTIAVNACRDYYRSKGYKTSARQAALDERISDPKGNVWEIFSRQQQREDIRKALAELPEYQKDALILKYYHDLKIKDIASITQSSEATVKSRLRQGIGKLRKMLLGDGSHEEARQR